MKALYVKTDPDGEGDFGRQKNAPILILGLAALILVDYFQLFIPELYRMVINGMNGDPVLVNGYATISRTFWSTC